MGAWVDSSALAVRVLEIGQWVALIGALGVAAVVDLRVREIPNACPVVIAVAGVVRVAAGATRTASAGAGVAVTLAVLAAASGVVGRRRDGPAIGGGDVKLLLATSLYLGLVRGLAAMALACAALLACAILRWVAGRAAGMAVGLGEPLPFAPAIAVGVVAAAVVG